MKLKKNSLHFFRANISSSNDMNIKRISNRSLAGLFTADPFFPFSASNTFSMKNTGKIT